MYFPNCKKFGVHSFLFCVWRLAHTRTAAVCMGSIHALPLRRNVCVPLLKHGPDTHTCDVEVCLWAAAIHGITVHCVVYDASTGQCEKKKELL